LTFNYLFRIQKPDSALLASEHTETDKNLKKKKNYIKNVFKQRTPEKERRRNK
jgi:hypothetical protein